MVAFMRMLDLAQLEPERRRPITRAEYHAMGEAGLFEHEHVELLDGVIVKMSPRSLEHDSIIERLSERLLPPLVGRARVRIQLAFVASAYSEPEPDVAIVPKNEPRADHPGHATLLIEVALTSLRFDRSTKASIYARAGVPAYWIVNVADRCIEAYSNPHADGYAERLVFRSGEHVGVPGFPDVSLAVDDVFATE
jgi:Uma2 family endonuclease